MINISEWNKNFNSTSFYRIITNGSGTSESICKIFKNSEYPYSLSNEGYSCVVVLDKSKYLSNYVSKPKVLGFECETLELSKFKCDLILKNNGYKVKVFGLKEV